MSEYDLFHQLGNVTVPYALGWTAVVLLAARQSRSELDRDRRGHALLAQGNKAKKTQARSEQGQRGRERRLR